MTSIARIKEILDSPVVHPQGESVRQKQSRFSQMLAALRIAAHDMGYELTEGDGYRDPRLHGEYGEKKGYGATYSLHKLRLAHDFNIFKDGVYLRKGEQYSDLGAYWISLGGEWGGSGNRNDGNHFSLAHDGRW
jgi:hypothetical protein